MSSTSSAEKDSSSSSSSRKRKSSTDPSPSPSSPKISSPKNSPQSISIIHTTNKFSIVSNLKNNLASIISDKQSNKSISNSNKEKLFESILQLVDLRQVFRTDYASSEERRKDLSRARNKWNEMTVKLQNFQYERNHYLSQIQRCREFVWSEDDVELIPFETFKLISSSNLNSHQMMVNRLQFENLERRRLAKMIEDLNKTKQELQDQIATKQRFMISLPARLEKISELSLPLQQSLNLTISDDRKLFNKAQNLATPLYIIFGHICAFKGSDNTLSSLMNIRIDGKIEEAIAWASKVSPTIATLSSQSQYSNPNTPPPLSFAESSFKKITSDTLHKRQNNSSEEESDDEDENEDLENKNKQNSLTFDQPPSPIITPPTETKKKLNSEEIYKPHPLCLVIEFKNPKDTGRSSRYPTVSPAPNTTPTSTTTNLKPATTSTTTTTNSTTITTTTTTTTTTSTTSGSSSSSSSKTTPINPISSGNFISLRFEYIPFLDLVVVSVLGTGAIQEDRHLLCNLFPSDTGLYSPNPSHHFNSAEVGQEQNGMFLYDLSSSARPYHWANWLCGANFPLREFPMKSIPSVYTILSFLRRRIVARQALKSQLEQLVTLNVPILDGGGISKNRDTGLKRQNTYLLATWKEVSMRDFESSGNLLEDEGIDEVPVVLPNDDSSGSSRGRGLPAIPIPHPPSKIEVKLPYERTGSRYFKAILQRGESRFEVVCEVPSEYPIRPPLFKIRKYTSSRSTQPVILIDNHCKSIETEVNIYFQDILKETGTDEVYLLATQIRRLIACLDIHYEIMMISNSSVNSNQLTQNYVGGKQWVRAFRGRARELPVVFDQNLTLFDQRPYKKKSSGAV